MVLRRLSVGVAKRFPTFQHLVQVLDMKYFNCSISPQLIQAGLLTENELLRLETLETATENKHYVSIFRM